MAYLSHDLEKAKMAQSPRGHVLALLVEPEAAPDELLAAVEEPATALAELAIAVEELAVAVEELAVAVAVPVAVALFSIFSMFLG